MTEAVRRERPLLDKTTVSVVLPVYDECGVLRRLRNDIETALEPCGCRYELIFVNDGSQDASARVLDELADEDPCVRVLHLSRNFGHQAALQAGLLHASGDAVVVMDSDLQDDPSCLPVYLENWREGYDVVYAVRTHRKESPLKRFLFFAFYRLLNRISQSGLPCDAGNFGLMDRQVVERVRKLPDRDRYFPGLRHWVGYRQIGIPVERMARYDNRARVSLVGLFRLAKTAVFSFSSFPLTMFYGIAGISLLIAFGLITFTLYHRLFTGLAVPGWTSIVMTASVFGALNAFGIAILGEYVIRIYEQVRGRPMALVARKVNFACDEPSAKKRDESPQVAAAWQAGQLDHRGALSERD